MRIDNPPIGGGEFTTRNRADRLVKKRLAVFIGECVIRFVARRPKAEASSEQSAHQRITGVNYDRISRLLTTEEMRHLPLAGDRRKAFQKPSSAAAGWSYRKAALRRS